MPSAQDFASLFNSAQASSGSAAGFSTFNLVPTSVAEYIPDALGGKSAPVSQSGAKAQSWSDAIKNAAASAVKAVTPGSTGAVSAGINGMSKATGNAVAQVGDATGHLIMDAADGLHSAGQGINAGARWATIILLVVAGLYIMSWLPRRA